MGGMLKYDECKSVCTDVNDYNFFVETGTYYGDTVNEMINHFNEVHSIELSDELYHKNVIRFDNVPNVKLHLGDSSVKLMDVVKVINSPAVFFLDGHWSGGETAQGDKDVPLLEELKIINDSFQYKALVIIDDYRLFEKNLSENWTGISMTNILNIVKTRLSTHFIKNDRVFVFLEPISLA